MNHFIGIEGGGTKFVCVHGTGPDNLHDRTIIKTQSPDLTIQELIHYLRSVSLKANISAIGIASFGPLDLDKSSATYGHITAAAKSGWENYNLLGALRQTCRLPIGFDTDVNGAALGEHRWGAAQDLNDFMYLTIGTGIGGGIMMNGKIVHGAMHPEMGHILIPQNLEHDNFSGVCSYHKNCLEGLASGTSMNTRWNVASSLDLPIDHPAWDLEAHYLGLGLANYIMTFSPKRIILGGGIMHQNHLLPKIHSEVVKSLNGYINCSRIINHIETYIVKPGLGDNSGICGAIALAQESFQRREAKNKLEFVDSSF
jgi:fructokinase